MAAVRGRLDEYGLNQAFRDVVLYYTQTVGMAPTRTYCTALSRDPAGRVVRRFRSRMKGGKE